MNDIQSIIQRGNTIIEPAYVSKWDYSANCTHNSWMMLGDKVLEYALDVIQKLNDGTPFEDIRQIVNDQNHSGNSYTLMCGLINILCSKGKDFTNYLESY